jgi:hypothetical protein
MMKLVLLTISAFFIVYKRGRLNGCYRVAVEVSAWSVQQQHRPIPKTSGKHVTTQRSDAITSSSLRSSLDDSTDKSSSNVITSSQSTRPNQKKQDLEASIAQLKRIIEREYITFFNPMECDYYRNDVTFIDPLTTLSGIDSYLNNVNMLSGRTMLGSILFRDARIILHIITGGNVKYDDENDTTSFKIDNIMTRWTLKFTFQILPWQPSPSFTGISMYSLQAGGPKGVQVVQQNDYWDAINLQLGGSYAAVSNSIAIQHFISLLLPGNTFQAKSAGPELPYTTLRLKGTEYEVRRYPSYTAIAMIYERRDEAFVTMGSYTSGAWHMLFFVVAVPFVQVFIDFAN